MRHLHFTYMNFVGESYTHMRDDRANEFTPGKGRLPAALKIFPAHSVQFTLGATYSASIVREAGFSNVTTKRADTTSAYIPADTVTAIDPGEGRSALPDSLVTLTSTGPTAQPTPTTGRPKPVDASTSGTPRTTSREKSQGERSRQGQTERQSAEGEQARQGKVPYAEVPYPPNNRN